MSKLFSYRDHQLYVHHSMDEHPDTERFDIHAHEWAEIFYCISGKGSYLVEGVQYTLEPQDIFIMRPGEIHKISVDPEVPYERIAIHFSPELINSLGAADNLLRPFYERSLGQHNQYKASDDGGQLLQAPFMRFSFEDVLNVKWNLVGRLLLFLSQLEGQFQQIRYQTPVTDDQNELVSYVNKHLFEDISLQSVADAFYRSRSQVSRIFQEAAGTSLWKYVMIKRLLAARAMIQRGESASAACSACGFSDYSAFYRSYKTYFGHSPKEDTPKQA